MFTITSAEIYFLQDLVLMGLGARSPEEISEELDQFPLAQNNQKAFTDKLQKEANRLGHEIKVKEALIRVSHRRQDEGQD